MIFHTKSIASVPLERKLYDFSHKIRRIGPQKAQTVRLFTQSPPHRLLKSANCTFFHTKSATSASQERKLYDFSHKIRHFGPAKAQTVRFFTQNPSHRLPKSANCTIFHTKSVASAQQKRKLNDFSHKIRHFGPAKAPTVRFFTQNPSHRLPKSANCTIFHTKSVASALQKRQLYDFSHKIRHFRLAQTVRFFTQNPPLRPSKSANCTIIHTKSATSAQQKHKQYDFSHKIRRPGYPLVWSMRPCLALVVRLPVSFVSVL